MTNENSIKEVEAGIAEASASVQDAIAEAVETVEALVEDTVEESEGSPAVQGLVAVCVGGRLDGREAPYKTTGDRLEFTEDFNGTTNQRHYLLVEEEGKTFYKYMG